MKKVYRSAFLDSQNRVYFGGVWFTPEDAEDVWDIELDAIMTTSASPDIQWIGVCTLRIPKEEHSGI